MQLALLPLFSQDVWTIIASFLDCATYANYYYKSLQLGWLSQNQNNNESNDNTQEYHNDIKAMINFMKYNKNINYCQTIVAYYCKKYNNQCNYDWNQSQLIISMKD